MADSVLSVRIDEELKKKFVELATAHEVGNKDLLQMMLAHFELEKSKAEDDGFGRDVEELQRLCRRIADIYVHMAERTKLQRLEEDNKESAAIEELKQEAEASQKEIEELKKQAALLEGLKTSVEEGKEELKKAKAELETVKELNGLLQQKNSQLETQQERGEAAVAKAAQLEEENAALSNQLKEKDAEVERQNYRLGLLQDEKVQKHQEHERAQIEWQRRFKEELALKEKEFNLALKEQRLTAQLEQAANLEALKEKYEEELKTLKNVAPE